jgi:hypothetical protein
VPVKIRIEYAAFLTPMRPPKSRAVRHGRCAASASEPAQSASAPPVPSPDSKRRSFAPMRSNVAPTVHRCARMLRSVEQLGILTSCPDHFGCEHSPRHVDLCLSASSADHRGCATGVSPQRSAVCAPSAVSGSAASQTMRCCASSFSSRADAAMSVGAVRPATRPAAARRLLRDSGARPLPRRDFDRPSCRGAGRRHGVARARVRSCLRRRPHPCTGEARSHSDGVTGRASATTTPWRGARTAAVIRLRKSDRHRLTRSVERPDP